MRERESPARAHLCLIALLALTAWAYRGNLSLGLTDSDALADVAAARVDGIADLPRQLWQPLTGGLAGTNANFWRPVTMLHYALLRGLFDWDPLGYQVWDLGLHLVAVVLVFALLRSARRPAGEALLGAGILALHPLGVEAVPAVARNIDLLFNVFGLLALLAITRGRIGLAFVAGLLAIGTKEVAVVLLPAAVLWAWWCRSRREALWLAGGWGAGVLFFLLGRTLVLHGWGGYRPAGTTFFLDDLGWLKTTLRAGPLEILFPGWTPEIERYVPIGWGLELSLVLLLAAGAGALVAWRRGLRLPAVGLVLVLTTLLLYALTALYSRRLLYVCVVGLSLGSVALLGHRWLRWLYCAWLFSLAPASPLFHRHDWHLVDSVARALTEDLAGELRALPRQSTVWVLDYPVRIDHDPRRRTLWRDGKSMNHPPASYSIRAWFHERLGREDIDLRFLDSTAPKEPLLGAQVTIAGDALRVTRQPLERDWYQGHGWTIESDGPAIVLRRAHAVGDEWLLVAGTPTAELYPVQRP